MAPSSSYLAPSSQKPRSAIALKIGRRDEYGRRNNALEGKGGGVCDSTYGACQTTVVAMVKRLDMASRGRSSVPTIMACLLQRS